uniref:NADH-ubiquinone oxidoreductase chain 6 n=1 Tax=Rhizophagus dispar TaxID=346847 RepID=A0A343A3E9_RHIDI|nr:NADH dehydrogenase subunit 6 [Rhizophagus dispar]
MSLLLSLMWMFSMLFMFLNHPLSFGGILLIQSLLISLTIGMINMNFWFSYILFLIMVGGMMILFIYMTSIASNEKFKTSSNLILLSIIILISSIIMMIFIENFINNSLLMNFNIMNNSNNKMNFLLTLTKYFNYPLIKIMLMIMIYLLITLIATVKITNISYGPLRQKF